MGGAKGKVSLRLSNTGSAVSTGASDVSVYISSDTTVDAGDAKVADVMKAVRLKPTKSKSLNVRFVYPTGLPDGTYYLLTNVQGGGSPLVGAAPGETGVSGGTVRIAPPFIDLAAKAAVLSGGAVVAGRRGTLSITVTNAGNVPAKGPLAAMLSSVSSVDGSAQPLDTPVRNINIKPGATKVVRFRFTAPATLPAGLSILRSVLDPQTPVQDSDLTNNSIDIGAVFESQ